MEKVGKGVLGTNSFGKQVTRATYEGGCLS